MRGHRPWRTNRAAVLPSTQTGNRVLAVKTDPGCASGSILVMVLVICVVDREFVLPVGGIVLTQNHRQECLSLAYVHAVTGLAGVNLIIGRRHDYGVDGTLRAIVEINGRHVESGYPVDFQLKASMRWECDGSDVVYDLEAHTYNDMVGRTANECPLVLMLLCLPKDSHHWLDTTEKELVLRHGCYWTILEGEPTKNTQTKRVRLPKSNLLTANAIKDILAIERGRRNR